MQIPMIPFRISKTFGACAISFPEVYEVNLFANSIIAVIINRNIFQHPVPFFGLLSVCICYWCLPFFCKATRDIANHITSMVDNENIVNNEYTWTRFLFIDLETNKGYYFIWHLLNNKLNRKIGKSCQSGKEHKHVIFIFCKISKNSLNHIWNIEIVSLCYQTLLPHFLMSNLIPWNGVPIIVKPTNFL